MTLTATVSATSSFRSGVWTAQAELSVSTARTSAVPWWSSAAGQFPATLGISTLDGSNGFIIRGVNPSDEGSNASRAGDVNGDGYDDIFVGTVAADPHGITDAGQSYLIYGRPTFAANFELSSLLAVNGGDGSAGYVINGFLSSSGSYIAAPSEISTTTASPMSRWPPGRPTSTA